MRIYYRGYVIDGDNPQEPAWTVQGTRPERITLTVENSPKAAMRWIDCDIVRQKVRDAGWLNIRLLSA